MFDYKLRIDDMENHRIFQKNKHNAQTFPSNMFFQ